MQSGPPLVRLRHETRYRYDRPVYAGPHIVRLCPSGDAALRLQAYSLDITPAPLLLSWQRDPHGNRVARALFDGAMDDLAIIVELVVDMTPINPFGFLVDLEAAEWPFAYASDLLPELRGYQELDPSDPAFDAFVSSLRRGEATTTVEFLAGLARRISTDVQYIVRSDEGVQSPGATLRQAAGSCRDTAWLLVQVLRALGKAARFVSGYLVPPPGAGTSGASELHAWAEVFVPGAGWVGLDPSSGILCAEMHLAVAATAHYRAAAPVVGSVAPSGVHASFGIQTEWLLQG